MGVGNQLLWVVLIWMGDDRGRPAETNVVHNLPGISVHLNLIGEPLLEVRAVRWKWILISFGVCR